MPCRYAYILALVCLTPPPLVTLWAQNASRQGASDNGVSGGIPYHGYLLVPSYQLSTMARSVVPVSYSTASRVRVLGIKLPYTNDSTLVCSVSPMDSNGNVVVGTTVSVHWKVNITSGEQNWQAVPAVYSPETPWITRQFTIAVCLDASESLDSYRSIIADALDSLRYAIGPFDSLSIIASGCETNFLLPPTLRSQCDLSQLVRSMRFRGINRLFHSALFALNKAKPSALIILTASDDHASLDVITNDLIIEARNRNIPIFCILIGWHAESLPFEVLSMTTGGRFYHLFNPITTEELSNILIEIVRTLQVSTTLTTIIPSRTIDQLSKGGVIKVDCDINTPLDNDSLIIPAWTPHSINPPRQNLALFDYNSSSIDSSFVPIINALATLLAANPSQTVELIGYAYRESDPENMRHLSLDRARAIYKMLVNRGLGRKQLRVRAMGDLKPLYLNADNPITMRLNRRVEFRWLDPTLLPYELVVYYSYRESDALDQCALWQQRGYRSYIEDIIIDNTPAFRVKLWGYATHEQAQKTARHIANRYRIAVTVE